jgi:hypothetical protein
MASRGALLSLCHRLIADHEPREHARTSAA